MNNVEDKFKLKMKRASAYAALQNPNYEDYSLLDKDADDWLTRWNFLLRFGFCWYSLGIVALPRIIVTLCFLPETAPLVLGTRGVYFYFIMGYYSITVHH